YACVDREWKNGDEVALKLKLEPRVVIGNHRNEGRLALLYGPLVLALDSALLPESISLNTIGVPSTSLKAMRFATEPAPGNVKTWSGAEVYRIKAVTTKRAGSTSENSQVSVELIPYADAGGTGSAYKIWLPYEQRPAAKSLLSDGVEIRSRKP